MTTPTADPDWLSEYEAIANRAGWVDLADRTQIELRGRDRATFLHNLCTNEIRKLAPGSGCEAFLTTVQGKTLGHVFVFAQDDRLLLDTVPRQAETILAHLNHYLVCEDVTLTDLSESRSEILLSGPGANQVLGNLHADLTAGYMANSIATIAGREVWLRRASITGENDVLISIANDDVSEIRKAIQNAGAVECGADAFNAARIEWGFPLFGIDITDKNLPQEVARDARAISFVKGCYLGQETVARIDALGHVNKSLVKLKFDTAEVPAPGLELLAGEQAAGHVTSAAYSPRFSRALALGYARRGSHVVGTRLTSSIGIAEVAPTPAAEKPNQ